MISRIFLCVFCFFVSLNTLAKDEKFQQKVLQAQKAVWLCHILRQKSEDKLITQMKFKTLKTPVFMVPSEEGMRPLVRLLVEFNEPGWKLFVGNKVPVRSTSDPNIYTVHAYLNSRISEVTFVAQNEDGEKVETVYLFAPEAREYKITSPFDSVAFSLGYGNIIYEQTSYGIFNGKNLLIGVNYLSPEKGNKWGILADFQISFFTFQSEPEYLNPQVYEADAQLTYKVKLFSSPLWRSRLMAGVSTVGMYSHGADFGFSNLYGPSLSLRSEYYQSRNFSYSFEFTYATYDKISLTEDRAFKVKPAINFNLSNLRKMNLELAYSNHTFVSGFEEVVLELLGLNLGLSF